VKKTEKLGTNHDSSPIPPYQVRTKRRSSEVGLVGRRACKNERSFFERTKDATRRERRRKDSRPVERDELTPDSFTTLQQQRKEKGVRSKRSALVHCPNGYEKREREKKEKAKLTTTFIASSRSTGRGLF